MFKFSQLPNLLTVVRIILAPAGFYFMLKPDLEARLLAGLILVLAGLSDFWDGYLARKFNWQSTFGKILDPIADKIMILGTLAVFSSLKLYPSWILLPVFMREIWITAVRLKALRENMVLAAEMAGKIKANSQFASLLVSYVYLLTLEHFPQSFFLEPLAYLNLAFLFAAVFLTVYSGWLFFRHNREKISWSESAATALYAGFSPKAPGTFGSLAGLIFIILLPAGNLVYLIMSAVIIFAGIAAADDYAKRLKIKDPGRVVIDEVAGMMLACWGFQGDWQALACAFFLFRLFDVLKPFPCRRLENFPGGWGIMMDDLMAGAYAWLAVSLLVYARQTWLA